VQNTCDGHAEALLANPTYSLTNQVLHITEKESKKKKKD